NCPRHCFRNRRRALRAHLLRAPARGHDRSRPTALGMAYTVRPPAKPSTLRKATGEAVTLAGAAIGGCALGLAQVPGGWLSGAMIGVAVFAAIGWAGPPWGPPPPGALTSARGAACRAPAP